MSWHPSSRSKSLLSPAGTPQPNTSLGSASSQGHGEWHNTHVPCQDLRKGPQTTVITPPGMRDISGGCQPDSTGCLGGTGAALPACQCSARPAEWLKHHSSSSCPAPHPLWAAVGAQVECLARKNCGAWVSSFSLWGEVYLLCFCFAL